LLEHNTHLCGRAGHLNFPGVAGKNLFDKSACIAQPTLAPHKLQSIAPERIVDFLEAQIFDFAEPMEQDCADESGTQGQKRTGHYGVVGMQERAQLVNGHVTIASQPQEGTAVRLII